MHSAIVLTDTPDRPSAFEGAELPLAAAAVRAMVAAYVLRFAIQRGELRGRLTPSGRYLVDGASLEQWIAVRRATTTPAITATR